MWWKDGNDFNDFWTNNIKFLISNLTHKYLRELIIWLDEISSLE